MKNSPLIAKVHFVAAKGGVGKTLISEALAHFFAESGHKTLLVRLIEQNSARALTKALIKQKKHNLYELKLFADQAIYEYLTLKIPHPKLLESLLKRELFRALLSSMPGIADLTRLGKIWFHADEEHGNRKDTYEKIVVDMPSSGFVTRFLDIASVVARAVKIGPLAEEARLIERYFANAVHARIHVIAVPEELIVNESILFIKDLLKLGRVHLGYLFINRSLAQSLANEPLPMAAEFLSYPELKKLVDHFAMRLTEEQEQYERLKALKMKRIEIAEYFGEDDEFMRREISRVIEAHEN